MASCWRWLCGPVCRACCCLRVGAVVDHSADDPRLVVVGALARTDIGSSRMPRVGRGDGESVLGEVDGSRRILEAESRMVGIEIGLAIFDMRKLGVRDGITIAKPVLIRELVHDFVEIPALPDDLRRRAADQVQLARLRGQQIGRSGFSQQERSEDTEIRAREGNIGDDGGFLLGRGLIIRVEPFGFALFATVAFVAF